MNTLLLSSDSWAGIAFVGRFMICSFLLFSFIGWITGSRVATRLGGDLGDPNFFPAVIRFVSRNSKAVYKKIREKVGEAEYDKLRKSKSKLDVLRELDALRIRGVITQHEFEALKREALSTTAKAP